MTRSLTSAFSSLRGKLIIISVCCLVATLVGIPLSAYAQTVTNDRPAAKVILDATLAQYAKDSNVPLAQAGFLRALHKDPSFAAPYYNLAVIAEAASDISSAISWYKEYLKLDTTSAKVKVAQGRIEFLELLKDLSRNTVAKNASPTIPVVPVPAPLSAAEKHYAEGEAYLAAKNFQAAEAAYREAITGDSEKPPYWNSLGNVLFATGRYLDATNAYVKAVNLNPKNPVCWANLAAAQWRCGFMDLARWDAARAVMAGGKNHHVFAELGVDTSNAASISKPTDAPKLQFRFSKGMVFTYSLSYNAFINRGDHGIVGTLLSQGNTYAEKNRVEGTFKINVLSVDVNPQKNMLVYPLEYRLVALRIKNKDIPQEKFAAARKYATMNSDATSSSARYEFNGAKDTEVETLKKSGISPYFMPNFPQNIQVGTDYQNPNNAAWYMNVAGFEMKNNVNCVHLQFWVKEQKKGKIQNSIASDAWYSVDNSLLVYRHDYENDREINLLSVTR